MGNLGHGTLFTLSWPWALGVIAALSSWLPCSSPRVRLVSGPTSFYKLPSIAAHSASAFRHQMNPCLRAFAFIFPSQIPCLHRDQLRSLPRGSFPVVPSSPQHLSVTTPNAIPRLGAAKAGSLLRIYSALHGPTPSLPDNNSPRGEAPRQAGLCGHTQWLAQNGSSGFAEGKR